MIPPPGKAETQRKMVAVAAQHLVSEIHDPRGLADEPPQIQRPSIASTHWRKSLHTCALRQCASERGLIKHLHGKGALVSARLCSAADWPGENRNFTRAAAAGMPPLAVDRQLGRNVEPGRCWSTNVCRSFDDLQPRELRST